MNAGKGYRAEARRQWQEWCKTNNQDIPFREWKQEPVVLGTALESAQAGEEVSVKLNDDGLAWLAVKDGEP